MSDTLEETVRWFDVARPTSAPHTFSVQFGVHCEEFAETLQAITPLDPALRAAVRDAQAKLDELATMLKTRQHEIVLDDIVRIELLDGLCDTTVTAAGCAQALEMDFVGAMGEVNASNFSKFEDGKPVLKDGGKIGKGKNYVRPNLRPYI